MDTLKLNSQDASFYAKIWHNITMFIAKEHYELYSHDDIDSAIQYATEKIFNQNLDVERCSSYVKYKYLAEYYETQNKVYYDVRLVEKDKIGFTEMNPIIYTATSIEELKKNIVSIGQQIAKNIVSVEMEKNIESVDCGEDKNYDQVIKVNGKVKSILNVEKRIKTF